MLRTSQSSPLRIDEISFPDGHGRLGLTLCPGKVDQNGELRWERDLNADLRRVKDWGAELVVTLMETHEFAMLQVTDLPAQVCSMGMEWLHLPIKDSSIPSHEFEKHWPTVASDLHRRLAQGRNILLHCRGGMGRTGIIAGRILIERGLPPQDALRMVRAVRSGAVETQEQELYLLGCAQHPPTKY